MNIVINESAGGLNSASLVAISLSLVSAFFALIFGLSAFLSNILGKVPLVAQRKLITNNPDDTRVLVFNGGTGPAILTRITVTYRDEENGIANTIETNAKTWFRVLWTDVVNEYIKKGLEIPIKRTPPVSNYVCFWIRKEKSILGAGETRSILEARERGNNKEFLELRNFMAELDVCVEYKSLHGNRYSSDATYHPIGNVGQPPLVLRVYLRIADIFGIFKW